MCVTCNRPTYNEVCDSCIRKVAQYDDLVDFLKRTRAYVESDVDMMATISRFAPLPAEDQEHHDNTEYASERLLREIDHFLEICE